MTVRLSFCRVLKSKFPFYKKLLLGSSSERSSVKKSGESCQGEFNVRWTLNGLNSNYVAKLQTLNIFNPRLIRGIKVFLVSALRSGCIYPVKANNIALTRSQRGVFDFCEAKTSFEEVNTFATKSTKKEKNFLSLDPSTTLGMTSNATQAGRIRLTKKTISLSLIPLVILIVVLAIFPLVNFFNRQSVLSSLENPETTNLQNFDKNEILKEISELYTLEGNQQAVVGKITNIDRLSGRHAFFKKARNGNYLLVMPEFTLIYDRESKTVVDIARENLLNLKEGE